MDNIVGYICSTPWGTVSRTTPSLGWTPVLPAIPDGWQDAGTGAAPTGFRIIVRPGTRFPTLFPKMPRAELAAIHAPDTEPGRWSLCWDHTSQSWEMRRGVTAEAAFIRSCSPPPAWPGKRSQTTAWSIRTSWTSWRIPARPGQDTRATGRRHQTS